MNAHQLIGEVCGNYVLDGLLDQGGVGLVFTAHHKFLNERVAIKMLHGELENEHSDFVRRFFQEAKTTRSINHPNVIRILDFGQQEGKKRLYLVMELLEGHSVAAALEHGPLGEREVARIGSSVAAGLQAAHELGIIHRDLKPGNIFLCADGSVKLLDFGLAKVMESASQTAVGTVVGTPQYMAPEQVRAPSKVGPRTDAYGLGAVLFKMVTGRLPFLADTLAELIGGHLTKKPPAPSSLARVSPELDALILQCLEKDIGARPHSLAEVKTRLAKIAERALQRGVPMAEFDDATIVEATIPLSPHDLEAVKKDMSSGPSGVGEMLPPPGGAGRARSKMVWGAAVVLVVAALGGAGFYLRRQAMKVLQTPAVASPIAAPKIDAPKIDAPKIDAPKVDVPAIDVPAGDAPKVEAPPPVAAAKEEDDAVLVDSDPSGAQVFADRVARGATPLALTVPLPVEIRLVLPGYKVVRRVIEKAGPIKIKMQRAREPAPAE